MTSYNPIIKNGAGGAILYVGLTSQADTRLLKSTPTLAAGDFKVSIDGTAQANLSTLPTNTPGAQMVKITLSQAEVNGDNITIVCSDAAGAEWCDLLINIQTTALQFDNLATPTNITAGTITTVTNLTNAPTAGDLTATMKTSVTTAATAATPTAAAVTGAVGSVTGLTASDVGAIKTQTDKLAFTVTNQVDANVLDWKGATAPAMTGDAFARLGAPAGASVSADVAAVKVDTAAVKAKTDILPAAPAAVSDIPTAVQNADALLGRNIAGGSSAGRLVKDALRFLRNKWTIAAGTLTVYQEDDSTSAWTATVSSDASAQPIVGNDPA